VLLVATLAPSLASADVPISDEARARFTAGVNLLKDPDGARYEEAYREFKAAYAASPSYKILNNLGLCAMKLERDDEAIAAYEKYLEEGKDQLEEAIVKQVKIDLQTLKAGIVHVNVSANQPGYTIIDVRVPVRGERITNAYGPFDKPTRIGVHQGSHQMTARLAGFPDVTWEFDTTGGPREVSEHAFEFKAAPVGVAQGADTGPKTVRVRQRPIPSSVWIGAAATGALAVGSAVVGVLALGKHSDYQSANDGHDPTNAQSLKDSGQTLNIVGDVLLGGAVVAGGVTAVLYFTRPSVEVDAPAGTSPEAKRTKPPVRLTPQVGAHGGGLAVSGIVPWM
jgi:hypothetical protein